MDKILKFLKAVGKNNNRDWFEKNKPTYLEAKESFDDFLEALHKDLLKFDEGLAGLNPRKLAFRIYRDVRFSKDKRPYKTNMGAGFSPHGKMEQEPGYYLHIEPGKSFIAGGLYMPDPANLARIRQEIDYNAPRLLKILNDKKFKAFYKGLDEWDKLKTMPKGYAKDHPHIELLKNKSFIVTHMFTDAEVANKNFRKKVAEACKLMKPFNDYLTEAIA
ncbi:MAG TPA: DUF2461 domain-containing protein [Cyclobacteriaceae bacterium]|nr:DUF2461 domain-containing protein [Cyclobacteriaceae bacterium]